MSASVLGIVGSNPAGGMDVCVVCCTVETKGKKPGQSRQRNKYEKIQREKKSIKIPVVA